MRVEIKSEFDGGSTLNFNCNESDIQITDVIKLILSDSACFKSNTRKIFTKTIQGIHEVFSFVVVDHEF